MIDARTRKTALLACAILLLAVAGCGGSNGDATTAPNGEDQAAEAGEGEGLVLNDEEIADAETYQQAQEEGELTVYSGNPEGIELALQEAFTEDTGIEVVNVRLPSGQLYERILSEYGGDVLEADVIRISDLAFVTDFMEEGILAPHRVPMWDSIPEEHKEEEGHYYTSIIAMMAFAYNTELVSEEEAPQTWEDLLDPKWQGNIGMHHAGAGGSSWSWALFQRQEFGIEYWEALAAQNPALYPSTATITEELVRGEISVAVNHPGTVYQQVEEGAPLAVVYPENGTTQFPMYVAKAASAPNPAAAEVFINWSMSQRGAEQLADVAGEYHPHEDAPTPSVAGEQLPPLEEINLITPSDEDWIELRDEWVSEWNQIYGFTG